MSGPEGTPPGVRIGDVSGGIHNSVIAGGDVKNTTVTVAGRVMRAQDTPTQDCLAELIDDVDRLLSELATYTDALRGVSPATPTSVQGALASVRAAAPPATGQVTPERASSMREQVKEAAALLSTVLDATDRAVESVSGASSAIRSISEKLKPVLEKLAVAGAWIGRLWLGEP